LSALAVDLGGTFLRTAVLRDDATFESISRRRLSTVFDGRSAGDVWADVIDGVTEDAHSSLGRGTRRIAISFPGPVSGAAPLSAPTLTGSEPVPLDFARQIEQRTGRQVRIVNDVAAAAAYIASTTNDSAFFVVTVSSGIGSRVYHRNARRTQVAYDGEIGHLVVDTDPNAPICDCGGRGHLGAISSGRGFERMARAAAKRQATEFAASRCGRTGIRPETLTNERDLVPALRAGDPWATALLRDSISPLSRLAFQTVVASGLERIYVIGGFASALGSCYIDAFNASLESLVDSGALRLKVLGLTRLLQSGAEASLRGAALARD
jgi:predicted NBD/HSP70 family sugar kinase